MGFFQEHPALGAALGVLPVALGCAWRWRAAPPLRVAGAAAAVEAGVVGALMILVHLGFVAAEPIRGWAAFEYDFHYYAMALFGLLNLALCVGIARCAPGWARGERESLVRALRLALGAVLLNAPVGPLQEFAILFTGGAVAIALLALTGLPRASR